MRPQKMYFVCNDDEILTFWTEDKYDPISNWEDSNTEMNETDQF